MLCQEPKLNPFKSEPKYPGLTRNNNEENPKHKERIGMETRLCSPLNKRSTRFLLLMGNLKRKKAASSVTLPFRSSCCYEQDPSQNIRSPDF
jgi:hypothetical protein